MKLKHLSSFISTVLAIPKNICFMEYLINDVDISGMDTLLNLLGRSKYIIHPTGDDLV